MMSASIVELFKYYANKAIGICGVACRHILYRLHGRLHDTLTLQTQHGLLTISTRDDGVGAPLYRNGQYEYEFSTRAIAFLKEYKYVPSSDVSMLDVGANIGHISIGLILGKLIDRAIAIEPEPGNFRLLCENVRQNNVNQYMRCLQMSAGDKVSVANLELSPNNSGDHRIRETPLISALEKLAESTRDVIKVKSLPLSDMLALPEINGFVKAAPSLIWIDVQGYEGYVFRGSKVLLQRGVPAVSEVWPYGIQRAGMTLPEFVDIVRSIWSDYWVQRRGRFVRYPISVFDRYLDELGINGSFENVVFTNTKI